MRPRPRVPPLAATLVILLALGGALVLVADSEQRDPPAQGQAAEPPPPHEVASPKAIARRLAALRRLEFDDVPGVQKLSAKKWRERTQEKAAKDGPKGEARETEAVADFLKLSNLAPPAFEVEAATEGVGELIGGFYQPKTKKLVLVEQPLQGPRGEERVIAHEFEHALQDQNYPKALHLGGLGDEAELALSAVVEGDATVVERRYSRRYLDNETLDADKSLLSAANLAVGLPPALVASVRFPYTAGADFVAALRRRGGWKLVDRAFRHPPTTSEQVLHPGKYLDGEGEERVELGVASALGPGWRSQAKVESGELDAILILGSGVPSDVAERAGKGWQGGAFESFRRGGACDGLCRGRRAAVVAYRWDTPEDAEEFALAAARYLVERVSNGRREGLTFPADGGVATIGLGDRVTAIAFAPMPGQARGLADAAAKSAGTGGSPP